MSLGEFQKEIALEDSVYTYFAVLFSLYLSTALKSDAKNISVLISNNLSSSRSQIEYKKLTTEYLM